MSTTIKTAVIRELMARDAAIEHTSRYLSPAEAQKADTAEAVYRLALQKLGVVCDGVDPTAYKGMFEGRLAHQNPYMPATTRDLTRKYPAIAAIKQL